MAGIAVCSVEAVVRYLAGVVIVEPAFQMDGVPAWHETAVLEDP